MNIIIIILALAIASVYSHTYEKCELARALRDQGFNQDDLPNWVCLVYSESSGETYQKSGPNSDDSYDYGLFQINNRYWCQDGYPGHDCYIDCNNLLNDDISDDSVCAKKIYSQYGFWAWEGWKKDCQGDLPDLSDCGL